MSTEPSPGPATSEETDPATYGSDLLVELLGALGIEYVALNPGATIRGFHESLVSAGNAAPEIILSTHEGIAVAIAHGYQKASGRPMAVGLHNIVGLQHATMALFNAWCDRVPMLVIGGSGPVAESRRRPWIDWVHAARQGELVRDYVKWEHEPAELEALLSDVLRGWQLACASPKGPVYLAVDTSLQEQVAERGLERLVESAASPGLTLPPIAASQSQIEQITTELISARQPVILASGLGRRGAIGHLVELAELVEAPVIEWTRAGTSFPSRHPLNGTQWSSQVLAETDLVLALNVQNLAALLYTTDDMTRENSMLIPDEARVIHVGDDLLPWSSWTNEHGTRVRTELMLPVDAAQALPGLVEAARRAITQRRAAGRRPVVERLSGLRTEADARWRAQAETVGSEGLTSANVAEIVRRALEGTSWLLANGSAAGWVHRLWDFSEERRYLGDSGGAGKGYGAGAAIGAALALKGTDAIAVDLQGDGDLLYAPGALWTAVHHQLPLLMIVLNNRSYYQDERHQLEMARARGRSADEIAVGIRLEDPIPDYGGLARSFGMTAFGPIASAADLTRALEVAIELVKKGTPVLIDCLVTEGR